eukprot:11187428-Lingulodinium_polyedra.AAC.1
MHGARLLAPRHLVSLFIEWAGFGHESVQAPNARGTSHPVGPLVQKLSSRGPADRNPMPDLAQGHQ